MNTLINYIDRFGTLKRSDWPKTWPEQLPLPRVGERVYNHGWRFRVEAVEYNLGSLEVELHLEVL